MHVERGNWLVEFREDYSQFFQSCNWYTFQVVQLEIENDAAMGNYEVTVALLGLGIRIAYTYDKDTEMRQELRERLADLPTSEQH